ncbi:MAG TPA: Gfo/Idh/MocA family oxidoreductase [Rudaea sp.]|nr:Gfo/Idh/MocA family oxidoreductase [Rudaea sp.]
MSAQLKPTPSRARIGFLGVGWIGRSRLQALAERDVIDVAAIADAHSDALDAAMAIAPNAQRCVSIDELLDQGLDGIVIATPSGAHAAQAIAALENGIAVFCQKPLARTAAETSEVVAAAKRADRLLDVDFSYRHVAGLETVRAMLQSGQLGNVYAVDLVFHNAYGPDKAWFYDVNQSGGGCVMDLGSHLVDLALWATGSASFFDLDAKLYAKGERVMPPLQTVEDYATAQWQLGSGACVRLACSWRLPAGCDAMIEASFYGTRGGIAMRNVSGSFYDFAVDHFQGTQRQRIADPQPTWGGGALTHWAQRVSAGYGYDASAEHLIDVAHVLDRIYGR